MIVLSRRADRLQRIRMLERGGDDFVKKPFSYPELRARIGAVLRRSQTTGAARGSLRAGPVVIDVRSREVRVCDRPVELSATEYGLLVALAGEPHRVFTREELLRGVWGFADVRAHPDARQPRLPAAAQAVRRRRRAAGDQRVGRRLPAVRSAGRRCLLTSAAPDERRSASTSSSHAAGGSRRAALARETAVERLFAQSAAALEEAAGALLHAATTFIALDGPLPGLFAEQAGALLAVAARFEEAADLTRTRPPD